MVCKSFSFSWNTQVNMFCSSKSVRSCCLPRRSVQTKPKVRFNLIFNPQIKWNLFSLVVPSPRQVDLPLGGPFVRLAGPFFGWRRSALSALRCIPGVFFFFSVITIFRGSCWKNCEKLHLLSPNRPTHRSATLRNRRVATARGQFAGGGSSSASFFYCSLIFTSTIATAIFFLAFFPVVTQQWPPRGIITRQRRVDDVI